MQITLLFTKLRAAWLYRRGMVSARLSKNAQAISDYTTVIEMVNAPANLRAMSLYNRALVYFATSCEVKAIEDLQKVLSMPGASELVRTEAHRKLVRKQRGAERGDLSKPLGTSNPREGI